MPLFAGFDIGIKNLAYCIIDSDAPEPGILQWRNINLYGDPPTCVGTVKSSGLLCGKACKWQSDGQYYCGRHHPAESFPYKQPLVKNMNMATLKKHAFRELDNDPLFEEVKYIVIESQPRKNQMMKMFATSIETYFLIRHQLDKTEPTLKSVKNSPAKHKLSMYRGPKINTDHIKNPYDKRKWLAEKQTEFFLKDHPDVLEKYFNPSPKKDDLADAFLHCKLAIVSRGNGKKITSRLGKPKLLL